MDESANTAFVDVPRLERSGRCKPTKALLIPARFVAKPYDLGQVSAMLAGLAGAEIDVLSF